jgi:hypothetical protein
MKTPKKRHPRQDEIEKLREDYEKLAEKVSDTPDTEAGYKKLKGEKFEAFKKWKDADDKRIQEEHDEIMAPVEATRARPQSEAGGVKSASTTPRA